MFSVALKQVPSGILSNGGCKNKYIGHGKYIGSRNKRMSKKLFV